MKTDSNKVNRLHVTLALLFIFLTNIFYARNIEATLPCTIQEPVIVQSRVSITLTCSVSDRYVIYISDYDTGDVVPLTDFDTTLDISRANEVKTFIPPLASGKKYRTIIRGQMGDISSNEVVVDLSSAPPPPKDPVQLNCGDTVVVGATCPSSCGAISCQTGASASCPKDERGNPMNVICCGACGGQRVGETCSPRNGKTPKEDSRCWLSQNAYSAVEDPNGECVSTFGPTKCYQCHKPEPDDSSSEDKESGLVMLANLIKIIFGAGPCDFEAPPAPTPTPTPITTSKCNGPDHASFPYAQYDLDYTLPIRDKSVTTIPNLESELRNGSLWQGKKAKLEYIPIIKSFADKNNWNSAFLIALWLEETAGSDLTIIQSQGNGNGSAISHLGCGKTIRPIQKELDDCIQYEFQGFANDRFANFMARYSGSSSCNGDILKGECKGNPFANNPNFVQNFKKVYTYIVPKESTGAIRECEKVAPPEQGGDFSPIVVQGLSYYPQCRSQAVPDAYWSELSMPGCGTYCDFGCGASATAMIFSSLNGQQKDPKQFMDLYTRSGAPNCLIDFSLLRSIYEANGITTQARVSFPDATDLHSKNGEKIIDGYLKTGQTALVSATVNGRTHFVWIIGKEGGYYRVMDPYWSAPVDGDSPNFPVIPYTSDRYSSFVLSSVLPVKKKI